MLIREQTIVKINYELVINVTAFNARQGEINTTWLQLHVELEVEFQGTGEMAHMV